MANVSSSNTTTLYSTTQQTVIQPGAAVATGQVNDANFTTLYTSGQQVNPNANLVVDGTLTVNGCAILTNCTSFNLLPTTATSINFGLEATALSIGASTGVTLINNQLATANYTFPVADGLAGQILVTDGAGTLSFAAPIGVGKTYDIDATSTTGGANLNLNSNVPTTDTVKFSNGTGVTVSQINASEIGIAIGQDVAISATPTFAGANLGNITVGVATDNTITTTTGDLILDSANNLVVVEADLEIDNNLTINADQTGTATITAYGGATSNTITWNGSAWEIGDFTRIVNSTPQTNNVSAVLTLRQDSTGTPAVGFGGNITYQLDTPGSGIKDAAYLPVSLTDTTPGAEDARFRIALMEGGTLPNPKLTVDSSADMLVTGDQFSTTPVGIGGQIASNDYWHIGGYSVAGAGNDGALEIATANNSNVSGQSEPIFVRQYGGGSTSGNVWPWGNTITRTLTLLDGNGNTVLPVSLQLNGSTSGYSKFTSAATSANIDYVLPAAQGAAATVLTNDGAGNLSWALPGGGGSTFGNITIGVVTDNTISTTTGNLFITSNNGLAGTIDIDGNVYATSTTVTPHTFIKDSAVTNNGVGVISIQAESTGTPAVGFGPYILANSELGNGDIQTVGSIGWRATDMTPNAENFQVEIAATKAGALPDYKFYIDSDGNISADGNLTLNVDQTAATSYLYAYSGATQSNLSWDGTTWVFANTAAVAGTGNFTANDLYARSNVYLNIDQTPSQLAQLIAYSGTLGTSSSNITWNGTNWTAANDFNVNGSSTLASYLQLNGSSSGYSRFTAPATGSNLTYVLPSAAGAANTVLTNDGAGNLTWALPGGGGSTFGNISIGVVTDNTISTTTGNLILDAASNIVQVDADQLFIPFNSNISMENNYLIDSSSLTTSTTAANQVLANMTATATRSAKFVVQITSGTAYQIVEILGIHDDTTATITVYGDVRTGANLATFDADVSGGNFRLLTTPVNAVTTYRTAITRMSV